MPVIQLVKFHTPVDAWEAGGTEDWSITKYGPESRNPVKVEEKGNSLHFTWNAPGASKHAGKTMRCRVPLTNIASVTEVDDEPAKEKSK